MVLTLCARSREPDAAVRASNILDSMEELHAQGRNVIANSRCYSAVITAWARSGSPEAVNRAFNLINRMEQNRRNGSPHGVPNAHCYNSCIHTIAKSSEKDKVKYCLDILDRMNRAKEAGDLDSAPTGRLVSLNFLIPACAKKLTQLYNVTCSYLKHALLLPETTKKGRKHLTWRVLAY